MSSRWNGSTPAWRRVRAAVLTRDGHRCQIKGPKCTTVATQVHHTVAWSGDPASAPLDTLVSACSWCNGHLGAPERHDPEPRGLFLAVTEETVQVGPSDGLREPLPPRDNPGVRTYVYRLLDADGVLLYVGMTSDVRLRLNRHSSSQSWWPSVRGFTAHAYPNRESAALAECHAIHAEAPIHNVAIHTAVPAPPRGRRVRFARIEREITYLGRVASTCHRDDHRLHNAMGAFITTE